MTASDSRGGATLVRRAACLECQRTAADPKVGIATTKMTATKPTIAMGVRLGQRRLVTVWGSCSFLAELASRGYR